MKIVVLDGYTENPGDLSWSGFEGLGEFTVYDRGSETDKEGEAIARIGDAEIVITNKTPITKRVLDSCPSIRYIGVLATGYNVVDYTYAAKQGIPVTNVPGYGTDTVAQFTFALLLEICHHVAHHSEAVHVGRWEQCADFCFCDYPQIELAGKTMGIIGFGRIGQKVGIIAKAFGMRVLAYSPHEYERGKAIGTYVNLETLLAESDIISLHCPLFRRRKASSIREPSQNEGWRHYSEQWPRSAHCGAGSGGRAEQRQGTGRRRGCGQRRAHQGR